MTAYVVHAEQGNGLFALFVIRNTQHGLPVTCSASQTEAYRAAEVLNRPTHTRHRRRRGPRSPLWVTFAYALIKASSASFVLITIYSYK